MKNSNEGLIKDTYEAVIKEIQTIITIAYILAVGIGMLFNHQKYAEFGINIFDYGDIFDFLIAPFSDFYILLFALTSILLVYILFKIDTYWKNKWPKSYSFVNFKRDKKPWFTTYRLILFVISSLIYLYASADFYGSFSKRRVLAQKDISIALANNEVKSGKFIGKTNNVLFLLENNSTVVIPITSLIKEIRLR